MPSEIVGSKVQPSASSGDEEPSAAKSLPKSELTLVDFRAFTEGADSHYSNREAKFASSPGKPIAGPMPGSATLSPCLAGGSTAATPSPLPDEDFKEEGLIGAAAVTAADLVAARMPPSQRRRFDETQKERRDEAEAGAEHNREHQMVRSRDAEGEGERGKDRNEAVEEDEESTVHHRGSGKRDGGGREALAGKGVRLGPDPEDTQVCPTALLEAGKPLPEAKRKNSYLRARCKTVKHHEEPGALNRAGFFCNSPSSPTFLRPTPTIFLSANRAVALSSARTSSLPESHVLKSITGVFQRKESNDPDSLCCGTCGTNACNDPSATPRNSAHRTANLPAEEGPEGKSGTSNLRQTGRTSVLPPVVISAAWPAPSAASNAVANLCVSSALVSLSDHAAAPRETLISCKHSLPQKVLKRSDTPRGSQYNWKARTQFVLETSADNPGGKERLGQAGLQDCSAQALQVNSGSPYRRDSSLRPTSTTISCRTSAEARSLTYSAKALLAAKRLVEGGQKMTHAEDAFDKVQRELQTRYLLVERCEEKMRTTPVAEQPQGNGNANAKPGLLPSGSILPLSSAGQPAAVNTWTDPIHAGRKTSRPPPPPPPPPPPCLPQLKVGSSAISWQVAPINGNHSAAATVPAAAVTMYGTSPFNFTPLAPAHSTVCGSMNNGVCGFSASGTGSGSDSVGSRSNKDKAKRTSLNPLAPAFQPQGPSLLLRLLSNAAERTAVESHSANRLHCQRGVVKSCTKDSASALPCAGMERRHPRKSVVEESCSVGRNRVGGFISDAVAHFTQKCVLRTLEPGNVPAKEVESPFPDPRKQEVLLPHLLTVRPEQQQQQSSMYPQQTCQKQLQQFHQAASIQSLLHCPSQRTSPFQARQQVMEILHHSHKQRYQQPHQQDIHRPHQCEDLQEMQGQRTALGRNIGSSEQRIPAEARSYISPHARGEITRTSTACYFDRSLRHGALVCNMMHLDKCENSDWMTKDSVPQDESFGEKAMCFAFMRNAEHSIISGAAAPALSRSSNPLGHPQEERHVAPVGVVFPTTAGGGLPGLPVRISPAIAVSHPLRAVPSYPLIRNMGSKAAGLDEGLAEVLDPLVANRMLLQLGKMLRLTHLQLLTVVRRAAAAGAPLRLTDLPAAFLKEHNAILDLRSLGLLHIREVIAGMGRSLLLSWKHQHRHHSPEERQRSPGESVHQHPDERSEQEDIAVKTSDAFGRQEKPVAAEIYASFFWSPPGESITSSAKQIMPTDNILHGEDSGATRVVMNDRESGGGKSSTERLKRPNGTSMCITTAKGARAVGHESISEKTSPVLAAQKGMFQYTVAPLNRMHGMQYAEATVDGHLGAKGLRETHNEEELFSFEEEGDLLLLEGDPLPSVMKELLQHLLVSLVADALHHMSPPAATAGACMSTDIRIDNSEEAVSSGTVYSVHQRGQSVDGKYNKPHHPPEETRLCLHGIDAPTTKESTTTLPCTTSKHSTFAVAGRGASVGSYGGSDTLEGTYTSGASGGPMYTRGLPLQLLPTLWQLKYGVRCNLPAMLETCGYASVRNFIVDALPCLQFSASGSHVALRLTDISSACPGSTSRVSTRGAEKDTSRNSVQTDKGEYVLCAKGDAVVPGKNVATVTSKAEGQHKECSTETATPAAAPLEDSGEAAAVGGKEGVRGSATLPSHPTSTVEVPKVHAQGTPAQQKARPAHELDSRAAEMSRVEITSCSSPRKQLDKRSLFKTQMSAMPKGETTAAGAIVQGETVTLCKQSDAANEYVEPATLITATESDTKEHASDGKLRPQATATQERRSANFLVAGESALPTVAVFQDLNISSAAKVDKKDCSSLVAQAEEFRKCSSSKVDQSSPLPTLLACPLVEAVAAAKIPELQQKVKSLYPSASINKPGVEAVGFTEPWKKPTLDAVLMENQVRQNNNESSQQLQHDQLLEDRVLPHHKLTRGAAVESLRDPQSNPPAAEKLAREELKDHLKRRVLLNVESSRGTPCSPEVEFDTSNRTSAAYSSSFEVHKKTEAYPKGTTAKKGCKVIPGKDGNTNRTSVAELVCPARKLLIASAKMPSKDENSATETLQRTEKNAEGLIGKRTPAAEESSSASKMLEIGGIKTAPRISSADQGETVGADSSVCAAHTAGTDALVHATETLSSKVTGEASTTTKDGAKRSNLETESSIHDINERIATGEEDTSQIPVTRRCCAADVGATRVVSPVGIGVEKPAETIAPQSRLHLHCMLYEVVATGCEKRGRAWARGEDLIELEEEVRQREAAAAQLQRLQQLRKRQQQQLFQQMVKRKEQLLGESHRIRKQMQEDQARKESEDRQKASSMEAGTVGRSRLSIDAKGQIKCGNEVAATGFTADAVPTHRPINSATRVGQDTSELTAQQKDKAIAAQVTRERQPQSTPEQPGDGTSHPLVLESRLAEYAEESRGTAEESASSTSLVEIEEENQGAKDTTEVFTSQESKGLVGRFAKQARRIGSTKSSLTVQRQYEQSSQSILPRVTTTVEACRKTNKTGFTNPRLIMPVRQKSPLSGGSLSDYASKPPKPKSEIVLRQQHTEETTSSSDDSISSGGALLSPTGLLLDEGIKVLMDERLVRRKLKKKAKKEKKKRKKLKLRALEMQEREQRRLLGLVDQLVELPDEPAASQAILYVIPRANKEGSKRVVTKGAGTEASAVSEVLLPQEMKSTCVSSSSHICVSSVAVSCNKATNAPDARCSSSGAVPLTPSVDMLLELSPSAQQQPAFERVGSKGVSQSTVEQCRRVSEALDESSLVKKKRVETGALTGFSLEGNAPSPGQAATHGNRCATADASSSHAPPLNQDTRDSPSLHPPSRPHSEEQQQQHRQVDRAHLQHTFAHQLQCEFVSPPQQLPSSEQKREKQQLKKVNQHQQTSLSLLSSAQLAEELRRYRNRSVGMLVSAIKGEWQRRFGTQAPSLSACMSLFKIKQLKVLLLEVPNLLILGSGGTMRVSTIEHALQFCYPFPPTPSTLTKSPSSKFIASPMIVTPSTPLLCFRAHIYTHDSQSNVPFPLTCLAAASAGNAKDTALDASVGPALSSAALYSLEAASNKEGRTTEENKQHLEIQKIDPLPQQTTLQNALASQELDASAGAMDAWVDQKGTEDVSCTRASALQYNLRTPFEKKVEDSVSSGYEDHSSAQILKVETTQAAGHPVEAARKDRAQSGIVEGGSCSRHTNGSAGLVIEGERSVQVQAASISRETINAFNQQTTIHPPAATAVSPAPTTSQAETLQQGESSDITTQAVEVAPIKHIDSRPSAPKTLVLGPLTADAARGTPPTSRNLSWIRERGDYEQFDTQRSRQQTQQQVAKLSSLVNSETQHNESVGQAHMEGRLRRLLHVQQEAFHDLRRYVSELQRQGLYSDQVDEPRDNKGKQQQRKKLQHCLAKLMLSIVEYRCYEKYSAFAKQNALVIEPPKYEEEGDTWRKQEHSLASASEEARPSLAHCKSVAEPFSGLSRVEYPSTPPGERFDSDEQAEQSKYYYERQLFAKAASRGTNGKGEELLLYEKLDVDAEAEEEAKDWEMLLLDLFVLGIGKREDQGVSRGVSAAADALARPADANKSPETALCGALVSAGCPMEPEEAARSLEQVGKEQQQQEPQKELRKRQEKSEQDLEKNKQIKEEDVQEREKDKALKKENTSLEGGFQRVDNSVCFIKQEEGRGLQKPTPATDTEEAQELTQNNVRIICTSHVEVWHLQKQGSTGVPLRQVLRDWRRVCYRLFHEVNSASCCSPRQGLTAGSNRGDTKEDSRSRSFCRGNFARCNSEVRNSNNAASSVRKSRLASSPYKFPAELLWFAGWSSVLPGLLLRPAEEDVIAMPRLCLTCNTNGEFHCYPAINVSSVPRRQHSASAAAIFPGLKSRINHTPPTEGESYGMERPVLEPRQHQQQVPEAGEQQQQQQQHGKCRNFPFCDQVSNTSPAADPGAATQQEQTLLLEHLPHAQGKHSMAESRRAQQQIEHQRQSPLWRLLLNSKFLSTDTAALTIRKAAASEKAGGVPQQHQQMTHEVLRKSLEQLITEASAAAAGHYRGLQAVAPSKEAVTRNQHVEQQQQHTVEQCEEGPFQHAGSPRERQLLRPQLQKQQPQLAQHQGRRHGRYTLQEVLHQRLEQPVKSRTYASALRSGDSGLSDQAAEHCMPPHTYISPSQQASPTPPVRQSATPVRRIRPFFTRVHQNMQLLQCSAEKKQQEVDLLLQQGGTHSHSVRKQDILQPQLPHLEQAQLQVLNPQQGLLTQGHMAPCAGFSSEKQETQPKHHQQMQSQQILLGPQGNPSAAHQPQQQNRNRWLPPMPLHSMGREVWAVEAGKERSRLPSLDVQHRAVHIQPTAAVPFVENQPVEGPSEKRLPCIPEAATFAFLLSTACGPYTLRIANGLDREVHCPPVDSHSRSRLAQQQQQGSNNSNSRRQSRQGFFVPCSSPSAPDFLNASSGLRPPCGRSNSRVAAVSWPGGFTTAPQFDQQQGFFRRTFRANTAALDIVEKQHEYGSYVASCGFPLTKHEQAIRHEVAAGALASEQSNPVVTVAVSAYKGCPNDIPAGDLEQLLTRLLLVDPAAAVTAASVLAPLASSDAHSASLSASVPNPYASTISTECSVQHKSSIAQNGYVGRPYINTALPSPLQTSGLVVGGAAQAQSSEPTPGIPAAAGITRHRCISCYAAERREWCSNINNNNNSSDHRPCAPEHSSVIHHGAQQLPVTETETQHKSEGQPLKLQSQSERQLCPEQLSSRFKSKTHMCSPWTVPQRLMRNSGSATPETSKDNSGAKVPFSEAAASSPPLCSAAEKKVAAIPSTALKNAENALVLLEQLKRRVLGHQQDERRKLELQSQQHQNSKPLHPHFQRLAAVREKPSGMQPQEERATAARQHQDTARLYEEELQQQQQHNRPVIRQLGEEFHQQQQATRQRREKNQQMQKRQPHRQQRHKQYQQQKEERREYQFSQRPAPYQPRDEPRLFPTCQPTHLIPQVQPWSRPQAQHQPQNCKAPAVPYPVRLQEEIEKHVFSLKSKHQTSLSPEAALDQTGFVSEPADHREELGRVVETGTLLEMRERAVIRKAEDAAQQTHIDEETQGARHNRNIGDTLSVQASGSRDSKSARVVHAAAGKASNSRSRQLTSVPELQTAAAERRAAEESYTETSRRFYKTEEGCDSSGRRKANPAEESHKAGGRSSVNNITTDFNVFKRRRSPVAEKKTPNASLFLTGLMQVNSPVRPGCKQQHTRQQQQQPEHVAHQQLVQYPESAGRRRNRSEQHRQSLPQPDRSYNRRSISRGAGSALQSLMSSAFSDTAMKNPSPSPHRHVIAQQQQPGLWLQQSPQRAQQQILSRQPQRQLTCEQERVDNVTQSKDRATKQKLRGENNMELQRSLHHVEEHHLQKLSEEDMVGKVTALRKQRDTRDDLSSYARRVFAQLNSSSKTGRAGMNSRQSPSSNGVCGAIDESRKPSPRHSPGAADKQLQDPAVSKLAKQEQLQQVILEDPKKTRLQRSSCAAAVPTDVASGTAHRQADATVATAEGPVCRTQGASRSPRMVHTIRNSMPDKSVIERSVFRSGIYAEQRGGSKRMSHHGNTLRTLRAGRRMSPQRASAPAAYVSGNRQKVRESTVVASRKQAAAVLWRRK